MVGKGVRKALRRLTCRNNTTRPATSRSGAPRSWAGLALGPLVGLRRARRATLIGADRGAAVLGDAQRKRSAIFVAPPHRQGALRWDFFDHVARAAAGGSRRQHRNAA